jgi:integral membrane protein (TIGR01906 family)
MKINKILVVILALFIPYIILMGGVRLIMSPTFAEFEYDRADFPLDPYGMETPERKQWAGYSIRYLTNSEPIDYLGNLQNFQGQKIFTESELSHMVDVKEVVQGALLAWYIIIGLSVAMLGWFLIMGQWSSLRQAFQAGGWVTLGFIGALLIFLLVSFDTLFDSFHRLFFADGTWLFDQSSTLIRLFPFVFWRDAFALVLIFALVVGILLVLLTRKRKSKAVA